MSFDPLWSRQSIEHVIREQYEYVMKNDAVAKYAYDDAMQAGMDFEYCMMNVVAALGKEKRDLIELALTQARNLKVLTKEPHEH